MSDWATISSMATAGGTLMLAVATFGSIRSANRAARVAERALLINTRPLLVAAHPEDPVQKVLGRGAPPSSRARACICM